ncbi:MAG: hypothetical protein AAFN10_04705 [Bacteroidota bacterium]
MSKNVLLRSLQSLDKREQQRFQKWVDSPYHNADPKLSRLLSLILGDLEGDTLDRERLDAALYPAQNFKYARITNHLSDIKALLEDFLVWERLKAQPEQRKLHLLSLSRERKLEGLYQQTDRYFERLAKRQPYFSETDFLLYQLVEEERYIAFTEQDVRALDQSLQRKTEWGDRYFVGHMLKTACQLLNRRNVLQDSQILPGLKQFLSYIEDDFERFADWPQLNLYRAVLQMLLHESDAHYEHFRVLLKRSAKPITIREQIPFEEHKPLYQYAQNYCIKQANKGQSQYLGELFGIYQEMIDQELIYYQGYLSPNDFKNIVVLGVRLQEYDWTEYFLDRFAERVAPDQRHNALAYNRAYFLYARGERRAALRQLTQVQYQDVFYLLGGRSMQLKIYYEMHDDEALEAGLHAFDNSLRRDRLLPDYRKMGYREFVRLLRKLMKYRALPSTQQKQTQEKLEQELLASESGIHRDWLSKQLQSL